MTIKTDLKKINDQYLDYIIKVDRRLSKTYKVLETKHHLIPTTFELIPNLTVKWTIDWLRLKNIDSSYKIVWTTLYIHENLFLHLTREEHNEVHLYLDAQKKALYFSLGYENECNTQFHFTNKNLSWYSFYPFDRHHKVEKKITKTKLKESLKTTLKKTSVLVAENFISVSNEQKESFFQKYLPKSKEASHVRKYRDKYYTEQAPISSLKTLSKKVKVVDLLDIIKRDFSRLKTLTPLADKLFSVGQTKLYDTNVLILNDKREIVMGDLILSSLLNKNEVTVGTNKVNVKDLEVNVYFMKEPTKNLNKVLKTAYSI